jgi:hypothetical protein
MTAAATRPPVPDHDELDEQRRRADRRERLHSPVTGGSARSSSNRGGCA